MILVVVNGIFDEKQLFPNKNRMELYLVVSLFTVWFPVAVCVLFWLFVALVGENPVSYRSVVDERSTLIACWNNCGCTSLTLGFLVAQR